MPCILCFGDSLTWGQAPGGGRHTWANRWPVALAECLPDAEVIGEGLPGRTTAFDTHHGPEQRNGAKILPTLLTSHAPLDLLVFQLGTNDVLLSGRTAQQSALGLASLIRAVAFHPYPGFAPPPEVLVLGPLVPASAANISDWERANCEALPHAYEATAADTGASFALIRDFADVSDEDGLHLSASDSRALGTGLADRVRRTLSF
ncbi:MAG: GDSL-type esterase/lipase family protein [Pseudomonadota bacterium]